MDLASVSIGKDPPREVNVVLEIPMGAKEKMEFDPDTGGLRLKRMITADVSYPGDYGFIPHTLAPDGDALDALVLALHPGDPLSVVSVRPIGVLKIIDKGLQDDKILCIPVDDPAFDAVRDIDDIDADKLRTIVDFFTMYKEVGGPDIRGLGNAAEACASIEVCRCDR